jgi:hypothetical protein
MKCSSLFVKVCYTTEESYLLLFIITDNEIENIARAHNKAATFRNAKASNPVPDEVLGNGHSVGIWDRNRLRPPCKPVNNGEQVHHSFALREVADQVDVKAAEATIRQIACDERGPNVSVDLGCLTVMALLTPTADIAPETVPDKRRGHCFLRRASSGVRKVVDGVESTASPLLGQHRSGWAC